MTGDQMAPSGRANTATGSLNPSRPVKVTCPVCTRYLRPTKGGLVPRHNVGRRWKSQGTTGERCPGSGQVPKETEAFNACVSEMVREAIGV